MVTKQRKGNLHLRSLESTSHFCKLNAPAPAPQFCCGWLRCTDVTLYRQKGYAQRCTATDTLAVWFSLFPNDKSPKSSLLQGHWVPHWQTSAVMSARQAFATNSFPSPYAQELFDYISEMSRCPCGLSRHRGLLWSSHTVISMWFQTPTSTGGLSPGSSTE